MVEFLTVVKNLDSLNAVTLAAKFDDISRLELHPPSAVPAVVESVADSVMERLSDVIIILLAGSTRICVSFASSTSSFFCHAFSFSSYSTAE